MSKPKFILARPDGTPRPGRMDPDLVDRLRSKRVKRVLSAHERLGNFMNPRDAIPILGWDYDQVFKAGRVDLDIEEWADFGPLYSHMGPPEGVVRVLKEKATPENIMPYTPDLIAPLRDLAAEKLFGRQRGDDFEVLGCEGAQAALTYSIFACVDDEDEVILTDPGYFYLVPAIRSAGGIPVRVPLTEENGFRYDPDQLREYITDKTKAIILVDPVNPFGTVQTKEELLRLAALAREKNIVIIDDVNHNAYQINPHSQQYPMTALYQEGNMDNVYCMTGLSSNHSMAAVRLGFLGGHPDMIEAAMFMKVPITRLNTNLLSQYAAIEALSDEGYIPRMTERLRHNWQQIKETVEQTKGVSFAVEPDYGIACFIDLQEAGTSSQELVVSLFKRKVVVYPADGLGLKYATRFIRVNFSNPYQRHYDHFRQVLPEALEEAQSRLYRPGVIDLFKSMKTDMGEKVVEQILAIG